MTDSSLSIQRGSGPLIGTLPFSDAEYQRRLDGVRTEMRARELDAVVTFTPENLYYLTGHDSPGYYFYLASVVTHDHPPINVLRRIEASNTLSLSWQRLAITYQDREDPIALTLDLLRELGVIDRAVGLEGSAWFITPKRYQQMCQGIESAGGQAIDASGTIEAVRVIKSAEEIAYIRQGARICERGLWAALKASHPSATENQVAAAAVAELIRAGGEYAGLPPFVTSGPRTSLAHSTWSGRRFQPGDILNYELPGVVKRYAAALFRAGSVGQPKAEWVEIAAMVREALEGVIEKIRPGVTSHEAHSATKAAYERHGKGDMLGYRTGYSIGIGYAPDWGEGHIMSIWEGDERPLRAGMTFHLVPGVYKLNEYDIAVSDTVLVTEGGCEVLTSFPREMFVV